LIAFTRLPLPCIAQNEIKNWYFNVRAGLSFSTSPPTVLTNGRTHNWGGSACVSDASGTLLFYTQGDTIWNSAHQVMANGTGLIGNSTGGTSVEAIKRPGSFSEYFIFTAAGSGFRYSIVDMSLAAGMGSVTAKNIAVYTGTCGSEIASVKNCDGTGYWLLLYDQSNHFMAYHFTSAGVNMNPVFSASETYSPGLDGGNGALKFSPNGKKLASHYAVYNGTVVTNRGLAIYDFDNQTGLASNSVALVTTLCGPGSVAFSPSGTILYMSQNCNSLNNPYKIYQFNLCAGSGTAIAASLFTIAGTPFMKMQNGPDGKIYGTIVSQQSMSVIHNPNTAGSSCNYTDLSLSISPGQCIYGLPNFPSSLIEPPPPPFTFTTGYNGCPMANFAAPNFTAAACAAVSKSVTGISWIFGDPGSGAANTSTAVNPAHIYPGAGNYTVLLIRHFSCTSDTIRQVVNITQPCLNVISASITCASLGSATITATGNAGPMSYTWLPSGQNGSIASGLNPGTHTILAFDSGNSVTTTANVLFTSLIPLTGNVINAQSVTCNGASTATASVINLAGGSGNQNYVWSNGGATYTAATPSLSAGLWSVTITDALTGCQVKDMFLIFQPPATTIQITPGTPTACAGGIVSLASQATGGTPGHGFQWTSGPASSSHTVTHNTAGAYVYTVSATDANTCIVSKTVSVVFMANPVLAVSHASICPLETGTVSVTGASSYTWNNSSNSTGISDNPLSTTVYTVTGEANTCTSVATATITLKPVPVPLISSNSPRCEQLQLQLFSNGGAGYVWAGPQSFGSNSQNPIVNPVQLNQAGVYNLTVTAANNCTASTSVTIVVNAIPTVAATGATVCTTQTLNLGAVSVAGATYLWNGPGNFVAGSQNAILNNPMTLSTGNYTVRATSPQGCTNTAVASALVVPPPNLVTNLSSSSLCAQAFNGSPNSIMMNATGGVTYTLSTPAHINYNSNPPWSLSSTSPYTPQIVVSTATLFGSNGVCTASVTASFSVIPNPTVTVSNPTPVICAGESFTYTSNGAGSYVWSSSSPNYTSISNGGVAVANPSINAMFSIVGSSLGCQSALVTSSMTVYPLPNVSVTPTQTNICIGSPAVLLAYGDATDYKWSPPNGLSATSGATVLAKPTSEMQYIVVGSANNCTRLAVAHVSVLPLPLPAATADSKEVCLHGQVIFNGSGGLYYSWNGPNNISFAGQTATVTASSFIYSGEYTLTVADKNGCVNTAKTGFVISEFPSSGITGTKLTGCAPFCSDIALWTKSNSVNARFTVNGRSYNSNTFNYCFQTPGTYTIAGFFTDNKTNCQATESLVLSVPGGPQADFYWLPETPVESLEEVQFINSSLDDNQTAWHWYFANDRSYKPETENAFYFFKDAGTYPIALIVTNSAGCSDTIVKKVVIEGDFACYIPNAFTPNTDSKNEVFLPKVRGVYKYSLSIFNRWGERVFYTQEASEGWDGEFNEELAKSDVYAYKIVLTTVHGEHREYSGQVTLYR
jgi:gliding motility-associated-like protein